jgi:hypothetical protein
MQILINNIERETEKAMLINCPVTWADNMHQKSLWFPKSVIEVVSDRVAEVKDWFINKTEAANAFHGYQMHFETLS